MSLQMCANRPPEFIGHGVAIQLGQDLDAPLLVMGYADADDVGVVGD